MGNRQATDKRKSTTATPADDVTAAAAAQDGDRKQSQPEAAAAAGSKKRRRGRGRKVTDVTSGQQQRAGALGRPCHPELITTTTIETGEDDDGTGSSDNRKLLHLTIYRSYSATTASNGSAVSHSLYTSILFVQKDRK